MLGRKFYYPGIHPVIKMAVGGLAVVYLYALSVNGQNNTMTFFYFFRSNIMYEPQVPKLTKKYMQMMKKGKYH